MTTVATGLRKNPLARFAEALEFLCGQGFRSRELVRAAEPALRRLLLEPDFLPAAALEPSEGSYARHSLHRDPEDRFAVAAMVWRPGQGTPIHDHDGTWGMLGMVQGGLEVVNYFADEAPLAPGEADLRHDPPHSPRAGLADCVCGCADIHQVTNLLDEIAVSIHVYARELGQCHVFIPNPEREGRFEVKVKPLAYSSAKD